MGHFELGWGNESERDARTSQFELRTSWQANDASMHFRRVLHANLLSYVGRVVKLFSPPQSTGLLFEFGPGMRQQFANLIAANMDPPKSPTQPLIASMIPKIMIPDDPGPGQKDRWLRQLASGAAIGASFRERGSDTSLHIAFNSDLCDVHVDRNGFVIEEDGRVRWDANGLLRHFTMDLLADKWPRLVGTMTYVDSHNHPLFQASISPWLAVELPGQDGFDRLGVRIGVMLVVRH